MDPVCLTYLDTNAFWDFVRSPGRKAGNIRLNIERLKRFVQANPTRIRLMIPHFAQLEYVHKRRDEEYCRHLLDYDLASTADLAKFRADYFGVHPDVFNLIARKTRDSVGDEMQHVKEWVTIEQEIPQAAFLLAQELVLGSPLSIFDALVLASAMCAEADIFVSNDGIFGKKRKGEVARRCIAEVTRKAKRARLLPSTSKVPEFVDQRSPMAMETIKRRMCANEQQRMSSSFLGQVVKYKISSKFGKPLLFYKHTSPDNAITQEMRIAVVGSSYSRYLWVGEIHDDNGPITQYVAPSPGTTKDLSVSFKNDTSSMPDTTVASPDDKVYHER